MCFDIDSEPPVPAGSREAKSRELTLTASDGNQFAAFEATGTKDSPAAVVVMPDVRGLYRFYKNLACRFAEAGYDAIAIDYFGRTAGIEERPNDWDFMPHVKATTLDDVREDVTAAVNHLRRHTPDRPVFTVGFCFGGSHSWHQAANGLDLSGVVGFYGRPRREDENGGVITRVGDMTCPVLALMGGADKGIPSQDVEEFEKAMDAAGVPNDVVIYPGAPHSFFDRKFTEFEAASMDAWDRTLRFIEVNSHI